MTDEEQSSLQIIAFRLTSLETSVAELVTSDRETSRALARLRVEEQTLLNISRALENTSQAVKELSKQHKEVAGIVLPKHEGWTETMMAHRKMIYAVAASVGLALLSVVLGVRS